MAPKYVLTNNVIFVFKKKEIKWASWKNISLSKECNAVKGVIDSFEHGSPEYSIVHLLVNHKELTFKELRKMSKKKNDLSNKEVRDAMENLKEAGCIKKA